MEKVAQRLMTFAEWTETHHNIGGWVGDMITAIRGDDEWPVEKQNFEELIDHMIQRGASERDREFFCNLWVKFMKTRVCTCLLVQPDGKTEFFWNESRAFSKQVPWELVRIRPLYIKTNRVEANVRKAASQWAVTNQQRLYVQKISENLYLARKLS